MPVSSYMLKLQKMLSTIEASITAMTLMAFLMGVYFASFLLCLRWLIFSDDGGTLRKPIHRPSLIITIILFVFSVTNVGLCLPRTLLFSQGTSIFSPLLYPNETINMFLEISGSIITDGVLIFRCWTVYNRSWRIAVLPFLFLLYSIASLLMLVYWNITNPSGDRWGKIMASYYVTTITINIYATSAIIFRIWRTSLSRRFSHFSIRVIAESGSLYTLTSIVTLGMMFLSSGYGYFIASAINNRTAGIAFHLILIRVAQNRVNPAPETATFISASTIERAIPAAPCHNSEMVSSSREAS